MNEKSDVWVRLAMLRGMQGASERRVTEVGERRRDKEGICKKGRASSGGRIKAERREEKRNKKSFTPDFNGTFFFFFRP